MASSFNLTIDDSSPLISYGPSGAWQDASNINMAGLAYTANTLHSTSAPGATATINFNGTGIEIYGGHRPEYGTYTLVVDGQTVASETATSPYVESPQLLGSATNLDNGPHTAVLTSTGVGMDIDWANLITQIGSPGSTTTSTIFDDASPQMTYAGDWEAVNSNDAYTEGTLHYTSTSGSAASLAFSGNAIAIYGTVSPDHANVQVAIDGQSTLINTQSSSMSALHPQTLLYYADGLDSGQHVLIVTNPGQQNGTGPYVDLDSITVYSASATSAGDTAVTPISNQAQASEVSRLPSHALGTGAVVGIALAVIIAVLGLLGLILFLFVRRKRRRQGPVDPSTPIDAELPMQQNMRFTPDTPVQPMPTFTRLAQRMSGHSIAPSYYAFSASSQSFGSKKAASRQSKGPKVPPVPTLGMPKMPMRAAQQSVMATTGEKPSRPP